MSKINCLIIDDHVIFTNAMQSLLSSFDIIGEVFIASNGNNGLQMLENNKNIQLLFLDLHMPNSNGFEVLKYINKLQLNIKTIVMTSIIDPIVITKTMEMGANAYLPKSCNLDELQLAINLVVNNQVYISTDFKKEIAEINLKSKERFIDNNFDSSFNQLSEREKEIVKMVSKGFQNKEIAEKLFISPLTVKTHRHNILQKLNLNNSAALVRFVTEMGLV